MSNTTNLSLHRHTEARLATTGERVFVVCEPDSDPRATVWVAFAEDPDRSAHVMRDQLVAL